jgi:hypothetical protein
MMKKLLIATACAMVVLGLTATKASALTVGDSRFIGQVIDGIPSNLAAEVTYINSLLQVAAGVVDPQCNLATSEVCDRSQSTLNVSAFPTASATGATTTDTPSGAAGTINTTGFTYLLAKYDAAQAGAYVWYVAGLTSATVPDSLGTCGSTGCGISHYSLFNPTTTTVPDGGLTSGLLGLSMLALGYLRRRLA